MASGVNDDPEWKGKARSVPAAYRKRRADLEPLIRLVTDVLALAAVLCQLSRNSNLSRFSEEETP